MTFAQLPHEIMRRPGLSAGAKLVWAAVGDRQGRNADAWPSLSRLANDTALCRTAVIRAVRELEEAKMIVVERSGNGKVNRYRIATGLESLPAANRDGGSRESLPRASSDSLPEPTHKNQPMNQPKVPAPQAAGMLPGLPPETDEPKRRSKATGERDTLTAAAVAVWCEVYREAAGGPADQPDGRAVGMLRRLVHKTTGNDLDGLRRRLRLAAGLDGRAAPFPFDRPGGLTVANVVKHWAALGDAIRRPAVGSNTRPRATPKLEEDIHVPIVNG